MVSGFLCVQGELSILRDGFTSFVFCTTTNVLGDGFAFVAFEVLILHNKGNMFRTRGPKRIFFCFEGITGVTIITLSFYRLSKLIPHHQRVHHSFAVQRV